jgi:hypothetical protein
LGNEAHKTRQKNVRQKNKELPNPIFIFLSHIFLSGLLAFLRPLAAGAINGSFSFS